MLCPSCIAALNSSAPTQWTFDRAGVPVLHAFGRHTGVLRNLIIAWKERGRADLTSTLAACLKPLVPTGALLVPVPTRPAARRARGECVVTALSREVAQTCQALMHAKQSTDQTRVQVGERAGNVDQTLRTKASALPILVNAVNAHRPLVVVDDIYTTGSTAREAIRALHCADVPVTAVVVLAAAGNDRWRTAAHRTSV